MSAEAWAVVVSAVAVVITLLGLTATVTYRLAKYEHRHQSEVEKIQSELGQMAKRAEEAEGELKRVLGEYKGLITGRVGPVIRAEIDRELHHGMNVLQAEAASVLVEAPPPNGHTHLVFLSALGPVASRIRTELVGKHSIAGLVMETGQPENVQNPQTNGKWNQTVDLKSEFQTQTLLTVPVWLPETRDRRPLAVCQFRNRADGRSFDRQDEQVATTIARKIGQLVDEFLADERNFEMLVFPLEQPMTEASVMFCDLTASTELLQHMNTSSALMRLDEYLGSLGEIALDHGAKLFANLGDGMMLSFNVPKPLDDHPRRALDAAWKMQEDFKRIWRGWQLFGLGEVHSRIAIAIGPVLLGTMGPKLFRQETIIGSVVNLSNKLCRVAPRGSDVIIVDEKTRNRVNSYLYEDSGFALHATLAGPAAWAWRSSSRVGVTSRDGRNWAAGSSRRSALSMSASDTVCLVRYQGARARWAATSAAGWPCWAYQHTTRLTHSRPKGTVRWTARGVRLRAWPTPATCRLSSNKTSTCQRAA